MRFKALFGPALLVAGCAFGTAAYAQNCSIKLQATVDMLMLDPLRPMVPVTINGVPKLLLLDTGGFTTQLTRETAKELGMKTREGRIELRDVSGNVSRDYVTADTFTLGQLTALNQRLLVSPSSLGASDGILSSDMMLAYDVEMDFGANKLNYFSPDHCPGKVVYWQAPAVAEIPFTLRGNSQIHVEIKLDGKVFDAIVETGATRSVISMPAARSAFGLTPDSPGVSLAGKVNNDPKLSSYRYTFSTLAFEGVTVSHPTLLIMPDRVGTREKLSGSIVRDDLNIKLPNLVLGMDVMRDLRIYLSVKEKKMYISAAVPRPPETVAPGQSRVLNDLDKALRLSPTNAELLNNRCYVRAIEMVKLDDALSDCEASLGSRPNSSPILDSKGFVLYRLARYQEALDSFNAALKLDPKLAPSLYMRGQTKRKLGDMAGASADIATAKAVNTDVATRFSRIGIAE
jgi:hypothetical protein